ncbi:DUF2147 domain-containing protein [Parvularcula maris]|uniref:DUF2147 domain-containing protein n=1 Tax=Parvularcula maris TaxID=2965077 RepID=A0A9X2RGL7_9PROT|nr:DUF2147 domain-containing protein [Parvularcula maris]MCQ8184034.1 DUF2147 domain-containing protein [Parvularcula maris]
MLLPLLLALTASPDPMSVEGVWWTEGRNSQVTIEREGESVTGRITWYVGIEEEQVFDEQNPDEAMRGRELLDMPIIEGFEAGRNQWKRGVIYDPTEGKSYRSAIFRMDEDTLGVKGCVAVVCLTQKWERVAPGEVVTMERAPMLRSETASD